MNYYQARQRAGDKRWDFTVRNDDDIRPVGYCRSWESCQQLAKYGERMGIVQPEAEKERLEATKDKFHGDGHATAEEAEECYKEYLLDHRTKMDVKISAHDPSACEICSAPTRLAAEIDILDLRPLCEKHMTRDDLASVLSPPKNIVSSY